MDDGEIRLAEEVGIPRSHHETIRPPSSLIILLPVTTALTEGVGSRGRYRHVSASISRQGQTKGFLL